MGACITVFLQENRIVAENKNTRYFILIIFVGDPLINVKNGLRVLNDQKSFNNIPFKSDGLFLNKKCNH